LIEVAYDISFWKPFIEDDANRGTTNDILEMLCHCKELLSLFQQDILDGKRREELKGIRSVSGGRYGDRRANHQGFQPYCFKVCDAQFICLENQPSERRGFLGTFSRKWHEFKIFKVDLWKY
jgi:hypothetical protein